MIPFGTESHVIELTDEIIKTDLEYLDTQSGSSLNRIGRRFLLKEEPLHSMIMNCKNIIVFDDIVNMLIREVWFPNIVDEWNIIRALKLVLERYDGYLKLDREFLHEVYCYWINREDELSEFMSRIEP